MARAVRKSGMKEVPLSEVKESKLRAPAFAPVRAFAWRTSIPSRDAVYRQHQACVGIWSIVESCPFTAVRYRFGHRGYCVRHPLKPSSKIEGTGGFSSSVLMISP